MQRRVVFTIFKIYISYTYYIICIGGIPSRLLEIMNTLLTLPSRVYINAKPRFFIYPIYLYIAIHHLRESTRFWRAAVASKQLNCQGSRASVVITVRALRGVSPREFTLSNMQLSPEHYYTVHTHKPVYIAYSRVIVVNNSIYIYTNSIAMKKKIPQPKRI